MLSVHKTFAGRFYFFHSIVHRIISVYFIKNCFDFYVKKAANLSGSSFSDIFMPSPCTVFRIQAAFYLLLVLMLSKDNWIFRYNCFSYFGDFLLVVMKFEIVKFLKAVKILLIKN
jgi:hypothetical protein